MYNRVVCRTGRNPNVTRKIIATNYSGVTKKQSDERSIDVDSGAIEKSDPTKHKQEQKRYKKNLRGGNVTSKDGANISRIPFPTFKKQTVTVNVRHADKLRRVLEQEGSRNRFTNILRIKMWKRLMELGSTKQPTVKVKRRRVEEKKKLLELPCTQQVLLYGSSYRMITAGPPQNLAGAYSSGLGNNCSATAKKDAGDARRPSFPQGTGTVSSCVPIDLRVRPTTTQSSTTRDDEFNLLRSGPPRFRNVRADYFGHHDAMNSPENTRRRSLAGVLREVERCVCRDCRPAFLAGVQTIARCHAELRRETQSRSVINQ
ncbi:hypothetical protein Bbelb_210690 [Branchiostoma belcheri]|nr:hypothetical protein Bbelb_210690 [Branchiostoma belcheri]